MMRQSGKALLTLARQERNRLWCRRVLRYLPVLAWGAAWVLLTAGYIHQQFTPLNSPLVLGGILFTALALTVIIALRNRPLPAEGAASTDRRLNADSLFVSSWELSRSRRNPSGVETLLLARAAAAMPAWRERLKQRERQSGMHPANLIALTLLLIGCLLLLLPSSVVTAKRVDSDGSPGQAQNTRPHDAARVLNELFQRENETETNHSANLQRADQRTRDGDTPASKIAEATAATGKDPDEMGVSARPTGRQDFPGPLPADTPIRNSEGSALEATRIASRGPGNDRALPSDGPTAKGEEFERIDRFMIETGSDILSGARAPDREGSELIASSPPLEATPAAAISDHKASLLNYPSSHLSLEQRIWVRRYFNQLDMSEHGN